MLQVGHQPDVERREGHQQQRAPGVEDHGDRHAQGSHRDDVRRERMDDQQPRQQGHTRKSDTSASFMLLGKPAARLKR